MKETAMRHSEKQKGTNTLIGFKPSV